MEGPTYLRLNRLPTDIGNLRLQSDVSSRQRPEDPKLLRNGGKDAVNGSREAVRTEAPGRQRLWENLQRSQGGRREDLRVLRGQTQAPRQDAPVFGKEALAAASFKDEACVAFCVNCRTTRPGEVVCVVGGHEALGSWSTCAALPLTTSPEIFPLWKSPLVPLPAGEAIEYKFLIQKEDRTGQARWQDSAVNNRLTPESGKVLEVLMDWEKVKVEVSAAQPAALTRSVERVEAGPRSLEEYVAQDLDTFWRWCPTPVDGLHRCGLLVKLFDYCGLTRKENKITDKVKRLNTELHALGVFTTDRVEPHQRVPYEAFVQSRRLRDAVGSCNEAKFLWDQKRRGGRIDLGLGHTPLALWVLNVIGWDPKMLPIGVSTIAGFVADDGQKMAAEAKRRAKVDETDANGQLREEVSS